MATQKVTPLPSPEQVPESITQGQLGRVVWLRREIERLQTELKRAKETVRLALEAGAPVEPGMLQAVLKTVQHRSVAWKAVVERELGEDYARRVLPATSHETYVSLAVTVGGAS